MVAALVVETRSSPYKGHALPLSYATGTWLQRKTWTSSFGATGSPGGSGQNRTVVIRLKRTALSRLSYAPELVPGLRIELNCAGMLDQSPRPAELPGMAVGVGIEPTSSRLTIERCTCSATLQEPGWPGENRTRCLTIKNRLLILMSFRPMVAMAGFEPAMTRLKDG